MSTTDTTPIRILLVDDHRSFMEAMKMVIDTQLPKMQVVAMAVSEQEALDAATQHDPDLVLLDMDLGQSNGFDLLPKLLETSNARVLFLTGLNDPRIHEEAIVRGARGVVLKVESARMILRAIEKVHEGEIWASNVTLSRIFDQFSRKKEQSPDGERISSLTRREREIISALVTFEDSTNDDIAERLFISSSTLKNHLTTIYSKLGLTNRVQLLKFALKHNLTDTSE